MNGDSSKCLACGCDGPHRPVLSKQDLRFQDQLFLLRCLRCSHVFLSSVPVGFDERQYSYYAKYVGLEAEETYDEITVKRHRADLEKFKRRTRVEKILDVGCGKGDLLWALRSLELSVHGIDLSEEAISVGQAHGLNVERIDFFSSDLEEAVFDVVTMYELIEHVPNPRNFLERAIELVRPGGIIYLTTPNFDSLDRRILGAKWNAIHGEHLSYFTAKSMRLLINRVPNVSVVDMRYENLSLQLLNSLRNSLRKIRTNSSSGEASGSEGSVQAIRERKRLRGEIEKSGILRSGKTFANWLLSVSKLGESQKIILKRE